MPVVPSTPIAPPFAAATAARAPGTITPSTGRSSSTRSMSSATALTVLHATTIALTPRRDEHARAAERVADDGLRRARSVGHARGVAEVDDVLRRAALAQRAHDRQAAEARVEDAERRVRIQDRARHDASILVEAGRRRHAAHDLPEGFHWAADLSTTIAQRPRLTLLPRAIRSYPQRHVGRYEGLHQGWDELQRRRGQPQQGRDDRGTAPAAPRARRRGSLAA